MLPTFSRPICPHVLSKDTKPFALPFWNDSTLEWDLYNHVFCCVKLFHSWPFLSWVDCNNNCAPILPAPVTFLIYMRWYAGGYSPNKWFLQTMRQKNEIPKPTSTGGLILPQTPCLFLSVYYSCCNSSQQSQPATAGTSTKRESWTLLQTFYHVRCYSFWKFAGRYVLLYVLFYVLLYILLYMLKNAWNAFFLQAKSLARALRRGPVTGAPTFAPTWLVTGITFYANKPKHQKKMVRNHASSLYFPRLFPLKMLYIAVMFLSEVLLLQRRSKLRAQCANDESRELACPSSICR